MEGLPRDTMMVTVLGAIEIALMVAVTYFLSTLVGSNDNGNDLAKSVIPITGILGGIVLLHTVLWYFYFNYHPLAMNMYVLVSGSMTMIFSLVALSVSLVNRS